MQRDDLACAPVSFAVEDVQTFHDEGVRSGLVCSHVQGDPEACHFLTVEDPEATPFSWSIAEAHRRAQVQSLKFGTTARTVARANAGTCPRCAANVEQVTYFFAMPDETKQWLDAEVDRLSLTMQADGFGLSGGRRFFLWPGDISHPPHSRGVVVDFPALDDTTLTCGWTAWGASGFDEPYASQGRRLSRQLMRSLRKVAGIPLFAVSYDGRARSARPLAWGTSQAVGSGKKLRQWRDGGSDLRALSRLPGHLAGEDPGQEFHCAAWDHTPYPRRRPRV